MVSVNPPVAVFGNRIINIMYWGFTNKSSGQNTETDQNLTSELKNHAVPENKCAFGV